MVSIVEKGALYELVAAAQGAPAGDFVEVGVYQGGSAYLLGIQAERTGRRLFLFDTFTGIPEASPAYDTHHVGDFADTSLEAVRQLVPTAIIRPGIFPDTLTDEVGSIALAHIDCDQYASTLAACELLGPRMASGGVMIFDDYNVLKGARKAVDDTFGARVATAPSGKARVYF